MTNVDRAIQVLEKARRHGEIHIHPHDAVEAIVQADLLAPDLPEPHREVALHTPEWFLDGPISLVVSDPSEGVVSYGSDVHNGAFRLVLTKEEAEGIALALLAAANHAEEEACPR